MTDGIQVYGTDWCGVTFGVREYLTNARIPYDYHNIEQDPHADEFVLAMNDGRRRFPLVAVQEYVITSPTIAELQRVLNEHRVRPIEIGCADSRPIGTTAKASNVSRAVRVRRSSR